MTQRSPQAGITGRTLNYPSPPGTAQGSYDTWRVPALTDINAYNRE